MRRTSISKNCAHSEGGGFLTHLDVDRGTAKGGEIRMELRLTSVYCAVVLYLKVYLAQFIFEDNQESPLKNRGLK